MAFFDNEEILKSYNGFEVLGERKENLPSNIDPILYESVLYKGKKTKVFAYLGRPALCENQCPAIVLVHGGNGKAEDYWVKEWTDKGYVALALDINAQMYSAGCETADNPYGGPKGYGSFEPLEGDLKDSWVYHSVAGAILARKILSTLPCVDANKIGIAGISWGGFVTYLACAHEQKFAFACVSYTAAYIYQDAYMRKLGLNEDHMGKGFFRWKKYFDPSNYIKQITAPILLIRGADDVAFESKLWIKTVRLFKGNYCLSLYFSLPHDQHNGSDRREIFAFADSIVKSGRKMLSLRVVNKNKTSKCVADLPERVRKFYFVFTCSQSENSYEWKWEKAEVPFSENGVAEYAVPENAVHWYWLAEDDALLKTSSKVFGKRI